MAGKIIADTIEASGSQISLNVGNVTVITATSSGITGNIVGNVSTTGTATFAAGAVGTPSITTSGDTNTGIYFPSADTIGFAEGGTQVGEFDSSGNFKFNSGNGSVATAYGCRAWVNFQGTSTVAIRGSGNVSSITDNGASDYTVNFTTAMPDANYSVVSQSSNSGSGYMMNFPKNSSGGNITTTAVRGIGMDFNGTTEDHAYVMVAIFR